MTTTANGLCRAGAAVERAPAGRPAAVLLWPWSLLLMVVLAGRGPAVQAACYGWDGPLIPPDTHRAAFIYDSARGVPTLIEQYGYWDWDGSRWTRTRTASGSMPVEGAVYDPQREVGWAFNSRTSCNCWNTTIWDRTGSFESVSTDGPPFEVPAVTFDSQRGAPIVFGGQRGTTLWNDIWTWNGTTWTRIITSHRPSARSQNAITFDTRRGVTVMFGGNVTDASTWELSDTTWTQLQVAGPGARSRHAMVYDPRRGVTVLFGGIQSSGARLGDTWEWDGAAWTQRDVPGPSPRADHRMIFDEQRGVVLLYGGEAAVQWPTAPMLIRDLWQWDGDAWTRLWGGLPVLAPLTLNGNFGAAYDANRSVTVFAGVDLAGTWEWDGSSCMRKADALPVFATTWCTYDPDRAVVYMMDSNHRLQQWDGHTWSERVVTGTRPAVLPLAYDSQRHVLIGQGNGSTWELAGDTWVQVRNDGPTIGGWASMSFDVARGRTILYTDDFPCTTREWDGSSWGPAAASPFSHHVGSAYDELLGNVVLFTQRLEGYEWTGETWRRLKLLSFAFDPHHIIRAVYDSARGTTVVFDADTIRELYTGDFCVTRSPQDVTVVEGEMAIFEVRTLPQEIVQYQWRRDGQPLPFPVTTPIGVRSRVLTIPSATMQDAGSYDVTVGLWLGQDLCQEAVSHPAQLTVVPRGDSNCDGVVDNSDIDAFVTALLDPAAYAAAYPGCPRGTADMNRDRAVDNSDIDAFVECLIGGSCGR